MSKATAPEADFFKSYSPVALYYHESDSIEYVRSDETCLYRRVDPMLTLVFSLASRDLIGFRLKGFKAFYISDLKAGQRIREADFLFAVSVLEKAMERACNQLTGASDRLKDAYKEALKLAQADKVELHDLPEVA